MAQEIKLSVTMAYKEGDTNASMTHPNVTVDVTGDNYAKQNLSVGTSEKAIAKGSATTFGRIHIVNLTEGAVIQYRAAAGESDGIELRFGEPNSFRIPPAGEPRLISDTAGALVEYLVVED